MATIDFVKATGPNGEEAEFVRSAYERVWKDKGWTEVEGGQRSVPAPENAPRQQAQAPRQAEPVKKAQTDNR